VETYQGYLQLYGPEATRTHKARDRLVELYQAWGKPQKAAEWRTKPGEESEQATEGK
jgi:hypothetical protein